MYTKCGEGEKRNLVKESGQTLCSQVKVLVLIWDSEFFLVSQTMDSVLFKVS